MDRTYHVKCQICEEFFGVRPIPTDDFICNHCDSELRRIAGYDKVFET